MIIRNLRKISRDCIHTFISRAFKRYKVPMLHGEIMYVNKRVPFLLALLHKLELNVCFLAVDVCNMPRYILELLNVLPLISLFI